MRSLRHRLTVTEHLDKSTEKSKTTATVTTKEEVHVVNKSPKLNKHRKNLQLKRTNPRSLLRIQLEDNNRLKIPKASRPKLSSEDLFESSMSKTSLEDSFESDKSVIILEQKQNLKKKTDTDVVDTSFLIQQTPHRAAKKKRLDKKSLFKDTNKLKAQGSNTLTQMLSFPIAA